MNSYPEQNNPTIHIFPHEREVDAFAAQLVIDLVHERPDAKLMVAAGNSTKGLIAQLISAYKSGLVSFEHVTFIGLDEYWKIDSNDPISTAKRMWESFFSQIGVKREQLILPDGSAPDIEKEITGFSAVVEEQGKLDLAIVGMGPGQTCHIGMNGPGSPVDSRIRSITLDEESIQAMMKKLNLPKSAVPTTGITIGMANILEADTILVLAMSESKAWGVQRSIVGPIDPESPASLLRYNPQTVYAIDYGAASLLLRQS